MDEGETWNTKLKVCFWNVDGQEEVVDKWREEYIHRHDIWAR